MATPAIERTPVASSDIASIGYHVERSILEVAFHRGGVYRYYDVPLDTFTELLAAPSKGRYFTQHIKRGGYRYERVVTNAATSQAQQTVEEGRETQNEE